MATKIQLRRDLAANWVGTNPVLAQGEPGVELDTRLMKIGDGVKAWNDLAYVTSQVDQSTTENMFVKFNGLSNDIAPEWSGALSVSNDGLSWTRAVWNSQFTTGDSWCVNNFTVGAGRIVYNCYDFNTVRAELRWAYNAFEKPTLATSDNTRLGPNGEVIIWNNVRYVGGFYVAVGSYYDIVRNNYTYPYAAYSNDGDIWTVIDIDLTYIQGLIEAENSHAGGPAVSGLVIGDVAYGNQGWLFGLHYGTFDDTDIDRLPAGAFYITDITERLQSNNWVTGIPGTYYAWFDGHGWITWAGYNTGAPNFNYPAIYFNSNSDPRQGSWRTVSLSDVSVQLIGLPVDSLKDMAAGEINGENWFVVADGYNGLYATKDQGVTWKVLQTAPEDGYISYVSNGNPAYIEVDNSYPDYEKITITGSNVPQLNGIWFTNLDGYSPSLYHDQNLSQPLDATAWGNVNLYVDVEVTGLFREHTLSVSSTAGLVVGMAIYGYGPWTTLEDDNFINDPNIITAIDPVKLIVTMKYPMTDAFNGTVQFRPVMARSQGDGIVSICYGDGAFVGFAYNNSNRAYKTTDLETWQHTSRGSETQYGPWYANQIYSVAYGALTTHGAMLHSDSRTVPGFTNFLSVADTFQVSVNNSDDPLIYSELSYNYGSGGIVIDPSYCQWGMGSYFYENVGTSIYTYAFNNSGFPDNNDSHNSVAISTWDYTYNFRNDGFFDAAYVGIGDTDLVNGTSYIEQFHFDNTSLYTPDGDYMYIYNYQSGGNNGGIQLYWDETCSVSIDHNGVTLNAFGNNWYFNSSGNIVLPVDGDIQDSSNNSVLRDLPQTLQNSGTDYTIQLTDRGRHVYVVSNGDILIPTNANQAFPLGSIITVVTDSSHACHIRSVDPGTTTLVLSKFGVDASVALPADTYATLLKIETDKWIVQI